MAQYAIFYDQSRCNGCKTCQMACKDYHDLPAGRSYNYVIEYEATDGWKTDSDGLFIPQGLYSYFVALSCNHCDDPACVKACPTGACAKDEATGIVSINQDKCSGAGVCVTQCPYSIPVMNEETKKGEKCDGCKDRVAEGKMPFCVEACPQRALAIGDAGSVPEGFERASVAPLPDPSETSPNRYIKLAKSAERAKGKKGEISNRPELK